MKNNHSMSSIPCAGTDIILLDCFIDKPHCDCLISEINKVDGDQMLIESEVISKMLWAFIENKISQCIFYDKMRNKHFSVIGVSNKITTSKNYVGIGKHRDDAIPGFPFKMAFYLNGITHSAGTNFYENGEKKVELQAVIGSGFIFDISLEHESAVIPTGEIKYMIGARPIIKYL